MRFFQDESNPPPFLKAFGRGSGVGAARGLVLSARPGNHVAIDQYAEEALGNREYFLNTPYSIGGGQQDHAP